MQFSSNLNLSASPSWREYDKEFSKLLEEIPRATSAPPHLDTRGLYAGAGQGAGEAPGSKWAGIEHTDIRFDEDYARFYEAYAGFRKLPPPVDGNTLELSALLQQQQKLQSNGLHQSNLLQGGASQLQQNLLLNQAGLGDVQDAGGLSDGMLQALQQLSVASSSPNPAIQAAAAAVAAGAAGVPWLHATAPCHLAFKPAVPRQPCIAMGHVVN